MGTPTVIAIDGPSGSGKGTLSQLLAKKTGFHLLDSGALYRLVALAALKQDVNIQDERQVEQVAAQLDVRFDITDESTRILLSGEDVTSAIRNEIISMNASVVAAYPGVREALLKRQRDFRQLPGLVADGRDMGTTVFPDADIKIFLTASAEARAQRRYKQLVEKGESVDMNALIKDIQERDERDSKRTVSPLKPAADAILLDSTQMTIEEVLEAMLSLVKGAKHS
ncbi:(d)CMP kinase [Cellvibrio sp. PSBB006]|uniref:(d)CMP kinase n=1 Tax=Cellvibrio sp. PSBB006 TaxID=1987723 RepID=UPI000B3B6AA2|nr:cytidylate kinase [Cellvibrio sp. PSBB006]